MVVLVFGAVVALVALVGGYKMLADAAGTKGATGALGIAFGVTTLVVALFAIL